ncbi:hypothetical protein QTN25_008654 [Entamoeba marina]
MNKETQMGNAIGMPNSSDSSDSSDSCDQITYSSNTSSYNPMSPSVTPTIDEEDAAKYAMTYTKHLFALPQNTFLSTVKSQPMRLTAKERILLEVLEAALDVSEYTDNVDVSRTDVGMYYFGRSQFYSSCDVSVSKRHKREVIKNEHQELKQIMIGLLLSYSYREGIQVINNEQRLEAFLQDTFEVGRRFKIGNPHMMRTTYQKMMHVLQDAILYNPEFIGEQFSQTKTFKDIVTIGVFVKQHHIEQLLDDELFKYAVLPVDDSSDASVKRDLARKSLFEKYGEEAERVILSAADGFASSAANCGVIHSMLRELFTHYTQSSATTDLSISWGQRGSRLSHRHDEQFTFVSQSLALWWNVMEAMPKLWKETDDDFLSGTSYALVNTGQGLQRMQSAPGVSGEMHRILSMTKQTVCRENSWKGLSVVHMGDQDVPNCLFFIDKYSQVPWIVSPIIKTALTIGNTHDTKLLHFFDKHSQQQWKLAVLRDFFRHGFDGSGSDGGSCIDGRLTSAWNWCSMIEKYVFYPLFLVTDFEGFEGPYKK